MRHTQFITDLEGPVTLNDNAFEITAHCLPDGARFFALISKYDDILADVVKRAGYRAGNTLKLILPFLLAFGLQDHDLREFSRKNIKPVPGAPEALQRILSQMPAFIVSTSYEPYVRAVCEAFAFPFENAYCTKISLDAYTLSPRERHELQALYRQILKKSEVSAGLVEYLDEVFWEKIAHMEVGRVLHEIQPIGGPEKARALREIVQRTGIALSQTIYVGDSITDVEALAAVRREGGIALAFNGNGYALRAAEFGCISPSALVLGEIAEAFVQGGREAVKALTPRLRLDRTPSPAEAGEDAAHAQRAGEGRRCRGEGLELTTHIDDAFIARSEQMRRRLRGEEVGGLG